MEKLKDHKTRSTVVSSESLELQKLHWPQELTKDLPIVKRSKKAIDPVEISIVGENGIKAIGYVARGIGGKHYLVKFTNIMLCKNVAYHWNNG